jgi:5-methyltetrahydrofolate--homocysteine methyltransferase
MSQELIHAITEMEEDEAMEIARKLLDSGTPPMEILDDCRTALNIVGDRFACGESFIPELMLAGEMLTNITAMVKPHLAQEAAAQKLGKVVIGTVKGDIHSIAKDIVAFMLDLNGFEVTDLGVDVPPEKFVEAVKKTGATIVGLSGFLTLAYDPMKETVQALKKAGLPVKVMIGGGQVDEQIVKYTSADAYGKDAMAAVSLAKAWIGA